MNSKQPIQLGRRIVVWGVTGSGKTTLARHLSGVLGLPHIELDAIRHRGAWDSVDFPEMRTVLNRRLAAAPDGWVIDGSYSPTHDLYLPRADTLVWLHLPWPTTFWRLFRRTITRAWRKEPVYGDDGPYESWRNTFLSGRSILWWSITNHRANERNVRRCMAMLQPAARAFELRSPREIAAFLNDVARPAESPSPRKPALSQVDGEQKRLSS